MELYQEIASSNLEIPPHVDFDIASSMIEGIQRSGKLNARAVARIIPTINTVLATNIISSSAFAAEGKKQAFTDLVCFALLAASGDEPVEPTKEEKDADFTKYAKAKMRCEKYRRLSDITHLLTNGASVTAEIANTCIENYIKAEYPGSPVDAKVKSIFDELSPFSEMDDSQIEKLAQRLSDIIRAQSYSPNWLYRIWNQNKILYNLGFNESLSPEAAVAEVKMMIERDPAHAYAALYADYLSWVDVPESGTERDSNLDSLVAYAKTLSQQAGAQKFSSLIVNPQTGALLVEEMKDVLDSPTPTVSYISPKQVAKCFAVGNGESQYAIHRFFCSELKHRFLVFNDMNDLATWLETLKQDLESSDPGSNMGNLRRKWLMKDIADIQTEITTYLSQHHEEHQ
ncbi:MAG: hypothetical protein PUE29_02005 [Olsenella sp.]|nr:hypothetical protein [Olsenella sp.]